MFSRRPQSPLSPAKLLERAVQQQINDFMRAHGWRRVRHQRTAIPGVFSTGEPGIADSQYIRYLDLPSGAALIVWIEAKSPTDKRKCRCQGDGKLCGVCQQVKWQARERALGAVVWVVDDFDQLCKIYDRNFGWLHSGDRARGQLDLLASAGVRA